MTTDTVSREEKRRAARDAMARIAADVALDRGITAVHAAQVAEQAGRSSRSFHNYFRSREYAVAYHLEQIVEAWAHFLATRPLNESCEDALVTSTTVSFTVNGVERTLRDAVAMSTALGNLGPSKYARTLHDILLVAVKALYQRFHHQLSSQTAYQAITLVWQAVSASQLWEDHDPAAQLEIVLPGLFAAPDALPQLRTAS